MEELVCRQAVLGDAESIVRLVNSAYRGEDAKQGWTTEADILDGQRTDGEAIRKVISDPLSVILLLHSGPALIGCVQLDRKNSHMAYLGMLTVAPGRQAGGIGRHLLQAAEDFVHNLWKISEIEMTVISVRTELIAWYQRRGYQLLSEIRPFPSDPRFGIPKLRLLEFIVLRKRMSPSDEARNTV